MSVFHNENNMADPMLMTVQEYLSNKDKLFMNSAMELELKIGIKVFIEKGILCDYQNYYVIGLEDASTRPE